jgi:pyruvate dehydrogenase E1 component beta subunit
MEPKRIYRSVRGGVSDEPSFSLAGDDGIYNTVISHARTARAGGDLAVFTYGATVPLCMDAAGTLSADEGVEARVVDLRSLYPLDAGAIIAAASECRRALVVHEAPRMAGIGAEVSSLIHERAMADLDAPVGRVTGFDVRKRRRLPPVG